jgi:hypothetical protein
LDYERYPKVQYRQNLLGPIAVGTRTQTDLVQTIGSACALQLVRPLQREPVAAPTVAATKGKPGKANAIREA